MAVRPEAIEGTEEIGAVETEVVEEMTGVEEVEAVVMMKEVDEAIVEEEVVVVDAVTTVLNTKTRRTRIEREVLLLVLEMQMLQASKEVIARLKPSFTIIRPTRKSSP